MQLDPNDPEFRAMFGPFYDRAFSDGLEHAAEIAEQVRDIADCPQDVHEFLTKLASTFRSRKKK